MGMMMDVAREMHRNDKKLNSMLVEKNWGDLKNFFKWRLKFPHTSTDTITEVLSASAKSGQDEVIGAVLDRSIDNFATLDWLLGSRPWIHVDIETLPRIMGDALESGHTEAANTVKNWLEEKAIPLYEKYGMDSKVKNMKKQISNYSSASKSSTEPSQPTQSL